MDRKTPSQGYFFVGKLWDKDYLAELSRLNDATVESVSPDDLASAENASSDKIMISFTRTLVGWDNQPVATLRVNIHSDQLEQLQTRSKQHFLIFLIFMFLIAIIFVIYTLRTTVIPLSAISKSLTASNAQPIRHLLKSKSEFGEFSRTLDKFIQQKQQLVAEIEKRALGEKALRESEEKFRNIFEHSAVGIMVADAQERIVSWNKFAEKILDKKHDELYLKTVSSLYPDEEWQRIRSLNIRKIGVIDHLETQMFKKDGSLTDVDISITVLKDAEDKPTGSIAIMRDISARKDTENKMKQLLDALEASNLKLKSSMHELSQESGVKETNAGKILGKDPAASNVGNAVSGLRQTLEDNRRLAEKLKKDILDISSLTRGKK